MAYLDCLKKNTDYEFDEIFDNLDRLRLEVDFGCIVINLIRCLWILSHQKITKSKFNFSVIIIKIKMIFIINKCFF